MIFHDPYMGHRKWWDPEWRPGPEDKDWTSWDYVLADIFQLLDDYTDGESGQFMPYDQSGDVHWDVKSKFSGAMAAIDKARDGKDLKPGETLYAVPVFDDRKPRPTLQTWIADLEEDKADLRPERSRNSRPPSAAELAQMRKVALPAKIEE